MDNKFDAYLQKLTDPESGQEGDMNVPEFEYSKEGTYQEIKAFQKKKEEIMAKLKQDIANLDDPNPAIELKYGVYPVFYDTEKKTYMCRKGKEYPITLGKIMTDGMWGLKYRLDHTTVPRDIRKQYLVGEARREISYLYNRQIMKHEAYREGYSKERGDSYMRSSVTQKGFQETDNYYTKYEQNLAGGKMEEGFGFIAEKMIKSYLNKLAIDYNLGIEVIDLSFDLDMYYRIDFLIKRTSHVRGVGSQVHAIQFTINQEKVGEKGAQIERALRNMKHIQSEEKIDDIVLVAFPDEDIRAAYKKWQDAGSPPGGPDAYLKESIKKEMADKVLEGYLSMEEKAKVHRAIKQEVKGVNRAA